MVYDESSDGEFLPYGMRIQVVDMQNGHAKLARDRGYVSATCSRIVKVDGPHDPACQIEGLLYSIATQKREICSKISGLHNIETSLINDLERALMEPYPIATTPDRGEDCSDSTQDAARCNGKGYDDNPSILL